MLGRLPLVSVAVVAAAACTSSPTSTRSDGCPTNMPNDGDGCILANPPSPPGAVGVCGYTTDTNDCGAVNCYCMNNTWGCNPTCAIIDASGIDQHVDRSLPESGPMGDSSTNDGAPPDGADGSDGGD